MPRLDLPGGGRSSASRSACSSASPPSGSRACTWRSSPSRSPRSSRPSSASSTTSPADPPGIDGLSYDAPAWTGLDPGRRGRAEWLYWVALGTLVLGYLLVRNLVKSRIGRAMVAVRDNPTAAAAMGVNVAAMKTIVFGLSAAIAGMAGCTFALRQTQTTPENLLLHDPRLDHLPGDHGHRRRGQPPGSDHRRDRLLPGRRVQPRAARQDLAPRSARELPPGPTQPGHPDLRRCS